MFLSLMPKKFEKKFAHVSLTKKIITVFLWPLQNFIEFDLRKFNWNITHFDTHIEADFVTVVTCLEWNE